MSAGVQRIESLSALHALAAPWEALLAAQPAADPFLEHRFLTTWLEHFGAGTALRALALGDAESCRGIAPLVLRSERWARMPVRVLGFPVPADSGFARAAFVVGDTGEPAIVAFLEHLARYDRDWDVLALHGFRDDSPQLPLIEREAARLGLPMLPRSELGAARVVRIEMGWDGFLRERGGHFRKHLRDEQRRLERFGKPSVHVYRSADEIEAGVAATEHVVLRRLGAASLAEVAPDDRRMLAFTFDLVRRCAPLREVELRILALDGQPGACLLSWVRGDVAYPFLTKYDPAFEHASPGRAVIADLVRDAARQGYRAIDYLSDWGYLHRFTAHVDRYVGVTIFARHLRARAARIAHEVRRRRAAARAAEQGPR